MLNCESFFHTLKAQEIEFFTGVPDSLLKNICAYLQDHCSPQKHLITPNEGNAIALATGYHLATKKAALVYMQNSGLGNTINPLTSLTDKEVYQIPILLMIGWRGEAGVADEPQHIKKGRITPDLLDTLEIPYAVLSDELNEAEAQITKAVKHMQQHTEPYALLVRKNTFSPYALKTKAEDKFSMRREEALQLIADRLADDSIIVATTGKTSRELYEYAQANPDFKCPNFMTVGAMGHASHIALGLNLTKQDRTVICFDGDGASLMHLGSFAMIGQNGNQGFKHIIFNNGAHESVGGQPTLGFQISFTDLAKSCGYKSIFQVANKAQIQTELPKFLAAPGPCLMEVRIKTGSRSDLGRPKESPKENKIKFLEKI